MLFPSIALERIAFLSQFTTIYSVGRITAPDNYISQKHYNKKVNIGSYDDDNDLEE